MIWVYQRLVGMPRIAAVEHPFGRPFGEVGDTATQRKVLESALALFETAHEPGHVEHLPLLWHEPPEETHWHPAEPSPIIALVKKARERSGGS